MSAPGQEFREAEYIGLGYLAVTSSELLARLLSGQQIDADEAHTLERAKQFLEDVASGAKLVTAGVPSNVSPVDTVRKFAFAVEPLRQLQDQVQADDLGDVFDSMAASIGLALAPAANVGSADLVTAKDFFHQLYLGLIDLIEAGKRRTGTDFTLGHSFAHA